MQSFVSDGVTLAYRDFPAEGVDLDEPILLIHGFASSHRVNWVSPSWTTTLTRAGRRTIVFDNRGHGESEKLTSRRPTRRRRWRATPPTCSTISAIGRADVMGYSMGARIGAFLARERAGARALADARRPRHPSRRGRRPAARHRRRHGGAVARCAERPDAAHVPRLRRPEPQRPAGARRLHPRLAPDADARARSARSSVRRWWRSGPRTLSPATRARWRRCCRTARRSKFPGRDHNRAVGDKRLQAGRAGVPRRARLSSAGAARQRPTPCARPAATSSRAPRRAVAAAGRRTARPAGRAGPTRSVAACARRSSADRPQANRPCWQDQSQAWPARARCRQRRAEASRRDESRRQQRERGEAIERRRGVEAFERQHGEAQRAVARRADHVAVPILRLQEAREPAPPLAQERRQARGRVGRGEGCPRE